jgi:hypothetical protein
MLKVALQAAMPLIKQGGLVVEFGVGSGRSVRMTQELRHYSWIRHVYWFASSMGQ